MHKPATKRSVLLMIVLALVSVACLALATATRAGNHKPPTGKVPAPNLLMRALDLK